jgi:UDP-N-acetylmuramate--alanine ligase
MCDIYAASESPIVGIDAEKLCASLQHPRARYVGDVERSLDCIDRDVAPGDVVLCLGAGSVGALPEKILALLSKTQAA